MTSRTLKSIAIAVVAVLIPISAISCGDGDMGLSRAEVEEIARAELANAPTPVPAESGLTAAEVERIVQAAIGSLSEPEPGLMMEEVEEAIRAAMSDIPEPGLTMEEVEEAIRTAMSDIPEPEPGPSAAEIREIARNVVASIPPRSAPADYTRYFVNNAISRYEAEGLEATLAYYNREESVDGQWYVFIIDENGLVIGHPDPHRLGLDLEGWVGTDANGYEFGSEMLSATEEGKWVSYVYRNPESGGIGSGEFEFKNVWAVRRDGLLFASGWYVGADDFTEELASVAVDNFREGGLEQTLAFFDSPGDALAGMEAAIDYYNDTETVEGRWFAYIEDPNGEIVAQSSSLTNGPDVQELLSGEPVDTTEGGVWVTSESLRVYVEEYDGFVFAFGWSRG